MRSLIVLTLSVVLAVGMFLVYAGPSNGKLVLKAGDEVYSRPDIARDGAYAEYIVVRETEVALKPKSIDHLHAAAIPLAALTAWQSLFDAAGLSAGQKVLIHAAAGGVGPGLAEAVVGHAADALALAADGVECVA